MRRLKNPLQFQAACERTKNYGNEKVGRDGPTYDSNSMESKSLVINNVKATEKSYYLTYGATQMRVPW